MKKAAINQMKKAIQTHGERLNVIFNTGIDPVQLCKKLRALEIQAHDLSLDWCNSTNEINSENFGEHADKIMKKVNKILFGNQPNPELQKAVFLNSDARGYALKIKSEYVEKKELIIYEDWGGYGIIAPDLRPNE